MSIDSQNNNPFSKLLNVLNHIYFRFKDIWINTLSPRHRFLAISFFSIVFYLYSIFSRSRHLLPIDGGSPSGQLGGENDSFQKFFSNFAKSGALDSIFPLSDSRDTSVQFELLSQVNGVTTVGKPISVTVRNTPQDRRRMRIFGAL